jgi:hypothetical protein
MGDCRGLKFIYRSDTIKGSAAVTRTVTKTTVGMRKGLMRRTRLKTNTTRTLVMLPRTLTEES